MEAQAGVKLEWNVWEDHASRAGSVAETLGYVTQPCMLLKEQSGRELLCYASPQFSRLFFP